MGWEEEELFAPVGVGADWGMVAAAAALEAKVSFWGALPVVACVVAFGAAFSVLFEFAGRPLDLDLMSFSY